MKLKTFPDDAATQLMSYATGRASLFRKRVKSVVFGPGVPTGKSGKIKHYGPLMESNSSDKGNMHTENQKELMARSYLEIVRNFIYLLNLCYVSTVASSVHEYGLNFAGFCTATNKSR